MKLIIALRRASMKFVRLFVGVSFTGRPSPKSSISHAQMGFSTKAVNGRVTRRRPKLATIGLAIGHPPVPPLPSVVTMLTMTRPTTSSIIAAPTRRTPRRERCILADERMAKVVPKEVEHKEAPAENAAKGVGYNVPELPENGRTSRIKDKAMGINKPTVATAIDIYIVFRSRTRSMLRPPSNTRPIRPR